MEGPERVRPQRRVLVEHQLLVAHLVVARGEPVVPDQRHPLHELLVRPHHAVEPPAMVVAPGVRGRERVAVVVGGVGAVQRDRAARVDE